MNLSNIGSKIIQSADDGLGKVFRGINKKIEITKIPDKLARQLNDVGVNVANKNARREVLASLNHCVRQNIDSTVNNGIKLATLDPEPGLLDAAADAFDNLANCNAIRNTGLARTADNSRNLLSFRYENLPDEAQQVVRKYVQNPVNVIKAYAQ